MAENNNVDVVPSEIKLSVAEKQRIISKKYYYEKVKNNPEMKAQENERIKAYYYNRYNTDEEYRQQKREKALKNYYNKKNAQKQFN